MNQTATPHVLFLAMGYRYVVMAINAARSVRQSGTSAHVKMITNLPIRAIQLRGNDIFDEITTVDCDTESNRWVKTRIFDDAAGAKNVLLDCDVEVLAPLNPLMALLDNFDVAARNLPFETGMRFTLNDRTEITPMSLSEINTGVILFSKTAGARELFDGRHSNFLNMGHSRDQPSFLKALVETRSTRFFALPPMWNATPFPTVDRRQMKREPNAIRILHYRDPIFWPAVAPRLAEVHDLAEIELAHPSTDFDAQRAAYSSIAQQYRSALFPIAASWTLLSRLMFPKRRIKPRRRGAGKRKRPVASA